MAKDIENREDIDALMRAFYTRVMDDDVIGYIFTDVARLDLDAHLPVIGDFWESLLLGGHRYRESGRNPLLVHGELSRKSPLEPVHFRRWLQVFESTVNDMFAGERADFAKLRAENIAKRMMNYVRGVPDLERISS